MIYDDELEPDGVAVLSVLSVDDRGGGLIRLTPNRVGVENACLFVVKMGKKKSFMTTRQWKRRSVVPTGY